MARNNEDKQTYCAGCAVGKEKFSEKKQSEESRYDQRIIWTENRIAGFLDLKVGVNKNLVMPEELIINEVRYYREKK